MRRSLSRWPPALHRTSTNPFASNQHRARAARGGVGDRAGAHGERVLVAGGHAAVGAHVEVLAHGAAEALPGLDLHAALVARAHERGRVRVVQVVQHHHAAVLGAAHGVELVVVALAQRQEGLPRRAAPRARQRHARGRAHGAAPLRGGALAGRSGLAARPALARLRGTGTLHARPAATAPTQAETRRKLDACPASASRARRAAPLNAGALRARRGHLRQAAPRQGERGAARTWRVSKNSHSSRGLPVSCVPGTASVLAGSRSPSWMPAGRPRPRPPAAAALRAPRRRVSRRRAGPCPSVAPGSSAASRPRGAQAAGRARPGRAHRLWHTASTERKLSTVLLALFKAPGMMHRARRAAARVHLGQVHLGQVQPGEPGGARTRPRPRSTRGRAGSATWPRPAARTCPACPARCPRTCARPSRSRVPAAPGGSTCAHAPAPSGRPALAQRRPWPHARAGAGVAQAWTQPSQPRPAPVTAAFTRAVMLAARHQHREHREQRRRSSGPAGEPGARRRTASRRRCTRGRTSTAPAGAPR